MDAAPGVVVLHAPHIHSMFTTCDETGAFEYTTSTGSATHGRVRSRSNSHGGMPVDKGYGAELPIYTCLAHGV